MRALIVDDSATARFMIAKALKEFQVDITECADGIQATEALKDKGSFSVAFVDWNMPRMNGLELVQAIRSQAELAEMKIIMVTTETELERVVMALEAGADEYLMKPFTKEMIIQKLALLGLTF